MPEQNKSQEQYKKCEQQVFETFERLSMTMEIVKEMKKRNEEIGEDWFMVKSAAYIMNRLLDEMGYVLKDT